MTGTREQVIEYMFTHDKDTKFDIDIHREKTVKIQIIIKTISISMRVNPCIFFLNFL